MYNKPVVVKGADGCEMHRTFKLRTPHQETHVVCTNRGAAFTKGTEEPSEVKSALIDRAVVQFVRTLGQKTHDDQEFEDHMSHPAVKRKLRIFRIMTCLMGLLKMLIYRQQYLRPDMALAQKLFDAWDERLDRKYGLPRPSPRKNIKRLENLVTMCCLNAVAHVFLFKETAHRFKAGETTPEFPKGKPFQMSMLWECVPLLQPTREMIHQAWCMGLEYNIGTSSMGLNTMTIVAEICGRQVGDWFKVPLAPDVSLDTYAMEDDELTDFSIQHETDHKRKAAAEKARAARAQNNNGVNNANADPVDVAPIPINQAWKGVSPDAQRLPELQRMFSSPESVITEAVLDNAKADLRGKRETRSEYRFTCSRSELQNVMMTDAQALVRSALGEDDTICTTDLDARPGGSAAMAMNVDAGMPENQGRVPRAPSRAASVASTTASGQDLASRARGEYLYRNGRALDDDEKDDDIIWGFHCLRAKDYPGSINCELQHNPTREHQLICPYCCSDVPDVGSVDVIEQQLQATTLSLGASCIWANQIEAAMFYTPQTVIQWVQGKAATVDQDGCVAMNTRPVGNFGDYRSKTSSATGAARVDIAWWQGRGEQWKSWHKAAEFIKNTGNRTVMEFDMHVDGLRDCLYLCSTRDNARRCPEEPRLPGSMRPEQAMLDIKGGKVGEHTACVKIAPYRVPGVKGSGQYNFVPDDHQHLPRHPNSRVPDSMMQRRMDSLIHGGRLCALNVLTSNKVINSPPWRMNPSDGLQVNVGAVHDHVALVAEAVVTCAKHPGLRNMQEEFCNNQPGPEGLSAPKPKEVSGQKRKTSAVQAVQGAVHTLPYSYDIVAMALAMDTASMLYDDAGQLEVEKAMQKNGSLGLNLTFNSLPHVTLRYIGYASTNRQTISLKIGASKPEGQEHVEAGDPEQSAAGISMAHVRRSLGKKITSDDVTKYISRKQGARSMGGVTGDLFAASTWLRHTVASLRERGLVQGTADEASIKVFADMEQCIQARVRELKSEKRKGKYAFMNMFMAIPGTYEAIEKQQAASKDNGDSSIPKRLREIDNLAFDPATADYGSDDDEDEDSEQQQAAPPLRRPVDHLHLGSGPMDDTD